MQISENMKPLNRVVEAAKVAELEDMLDDLI